MAVKRSIKRNVNADNILLEDAFSEFIDEKNVHGSSPSTLSSYTQSFNKFKGFMGDNNTGDSINVQSIYKWIAKQGHYIRI